MIKNNKYTITVALLILFLSLTSSSTFSNSGFPDIPYIDKMAHFGFYFLFMAVIILEHRAILINTRKLLLVAVIPFSFGAIIELLQSGIEIIHRKGEVLDLMFNTAGIAAAIFIWLLIKPYHAQNIR